jgi:hypothetical protein
MSARFFIFAAAGITLDGWCPAEFDGVSCWTPTKPGRISAHNCPPTFKQVKGASKENDLAVLQTFICSYFLCFY